MKEPRSRKLKHLSFVLALTLFFVNFSTFKVKAESSNTYLTSIVINGHKVQNFNPAVTSYNLDLPLNTEKDNLFVMAETYDKKATLSIEGNRVVNNSALVRITVTAEDGLTKNTYYVNVQLKEFYDYKGFSKVKVSDFSSLALKSDGTLYGWGDNNFGQLGDGTIKPKVSPVQVKDITNVIDFDISSSHSIALTAEGMVWVWGMNDYGQLNKDSRENVLKPIKVSNIDHVKKVRAGNRYSLALDNSGMVWQWGFNSNGQFGDTEEPSENYIFKPSAFEKFLNIKIKDIAVGDYHSLALSEEGKVYAWGANSNGQLGDGTENAKYTPVEVPGLSNIKYIFSKGNSSAAIRADGTVYYWGESNFSSKASNIKSPVNLEVDNKNIIDMDIKANHLVLLYEDGQAFSLGLNNYGQLGDGTYYNRVDSFTPVGNIGSIKDVAVGLYNTTLITDEGIIYSVGRNDKGQLGIGTVGENFNIPQQINNIITKVSMVYANYNVGQVPKYTSLRLTTDTVGADIYYTLDGSEPNEKSKLYKEPISIVESTTVKAVAIKYENRSAVSTFDYIVSQVPKEEVNINIGNKQGKAGDTLEIPVSFSKVPARGIAATKFTIKFNPDVLEIQEITPGELVKQKGDLTYTMLSKDTISINFYDASKSLRNITKDGVFANLKFKVKEGTLDGRYTLDREFYTYEVMRDKNYSNIKFTSNNGYIDIKNVMYGDVDGDDKVTAADLQYIQRYVAKKISYFPSSNGLDRGDVNRDGTIDDKDIELVKKIILN